MCYHADKLMIDGHTHTQATTIPEGQNWPRVIIPWSGHDIAHVMVAVTDLLKQLGLIDDLTQDCGNSFAYALELTHSCIEP